MLTPKNLHQACLFGLLLMLIYCVATIICWPNSRVDVVVQGNLCLLPLGFASLLLSTRITGRWSHPVLTSATLFAGAACTYVILFQGFNLLGYNGFTEFSVTHYLTSHFFNFVAYFTLGLIASGIVWAIETPWRRPAVIAQG